MTQRRSDGLEGKVDLLGTKMDHLATGLDALMHRTIRVEEGVEGLRGDVRDQTHVLMGILAQFRRQEPRHQVVILLGGVVILLLFWIVHLV